ncbi:tRNA lysidine(34) synthetase TilS [Halanaerocella petrolearia]
MVDNIKLINKVKTTIDKYQLLTTNDQILVAVSGGLDSLSLLHILRKLQSEYQLDLHIAHLNHRLRGQAALADAQFVKEIANSWQIPVTIEAYDVKAYQKKEGLSLEDAARQVRYNFFFELMNELGFDKIALGHHADDQAETVLMKFLRGAGLKGLGGIAPKNDKLIRPLIEVTKKYLEDYCKQQNLTPRLDETNLEAVYKRNKIRLELLPVLEKEYNNNIVATLNRTAEIFRTEDDYLNQQAKETLQEITIKQSEKQLVIDLEKFLQLHTALQRRIIREAVRYCKDDYQDLYYQHIESIMKLATTKETGKRVELPADLIVRLNYNQLIFSIGGLMEDRFDFEYQIALEEIEIPELGIIISSEIVDSNYPWRQEIDNSNYGFFDYKQVGSPFYIRSRQSGDRFYPLGMKGRKKIKDFFIDQKLAIWKRDQVPIFVTEGNDIFWVGGLRVDDRFKVTEDTEQILMIKIKEEL